MVSTDIQKQPSLSRISIQSSRAELTRGAKNKQLCKNVSSADVCNVEVTLILDLLK